MREIENRHARATEHFGKGRMLQQLVGRPPDMIVASTGSFSRMNSDSLILMSGRARVPISNDCPAPAWLSGVKIDQQHPLVFFGFLPGLLVIVVPKQVGFRGWLAYRR